MTPWMVQNNMAIPRLNYDVISTEYNQRYPSSQTWERGQALLELVRSIHAQSALEVGCGTGYWLNLLHEVTPRLYGLDYSAGMISQARQQPAPLQLTRGTAIHLPYADSSFDLIYCVDAIHHFGSHTQFIREAFRVLKPGGVLAILGHDPHNADETWYIYDYFESVHETDLLRYPSGGMVRSAMRQAGFEDFQARDAEHIHNLFMNEDVLNDPFIKHSATSQLALLNEDQYQRGLDRIRSEIRSVRERGGQVLFRSDFWVRMFTGRKPDID